MRITTEKRNEWLSDQLPNDEARLVPRSDPVGDARTARYNELNGAMGRRRSSHNQLLDAQSLALRAHQQAVREEVSDQSFELRRQTLELNKIKTLTDIQKARHLQDIERQTIEHTSAALGELGGLNPGDPDYQSKMADIFRRNPAASKDAAVQAIVKHQLDSRSVVDKTTLAIQQHEEGQADIFAQRHGIPKVYDQQGRPDIGAMQKALNDRQQKTFEDSQEAGLVPSQARIGDVTMTRPKEAAAPELPSLERERALHVRMLDRAKRIRASAKDENVIKDADADIVESQRSLEDTESRIRSLRDGTAPLAAPATTSAPPPSPQAAHDGVPNSAATTATVTKPPQTAQEWLAANPNDPRAAAIRAKLGIK